MSVVRMNPLYCNRIEWKVTLLSYGQFNVSNMEHGIVFNNLTLFNDVIYNLVTGLRQNRIVVRGTKTAERNGTVRCVWIHTKSR
jgi:hypothetical protein